MPLSNFTFFVTTSGSVEVNPVFDEPATLLFEDKEDEDIGVYIRTLNTQFTFRGDDYNLIYDNYEVSGTCEKLPFEIKYKGGSYYTGTLNVGTNRLSWDRSKCRFRATIAPSGNYTCLESGWEDEFNMFSNVTEVTVQPFLGTITETTCGPVNNASPVQINGYFEQNVSGCLSGSGGLSAWALKRAYIDEITPGSSYDHYATFVSEQVTVACSGGSPVAPPGDGWVLITDNCPTDATYGRAPQMIYSGEFSATTGYYWDNQYSVAGNMATEIDNGVPLNDLLEAENPCDSLTIVSDFFGINPSGDYPSGSNAYTEAISNLQNVVIFQKSDVKRADASDNATTGTWTYKNLLNHLKTMFNIEWRITGSTFRIEHVSFWERAQGLDLTAAPYATEIAGLDAYSRNTEGVARYENWTFMENASQLFQAQRIRYGDCAGDEAEEETTYTTDQANNDVGYIQENTDQVSDEGFVFVNAYKSGSDYYMITEASELGGDLLQNGHMSWPNLMEHYHVWRRPLPTGVLNNVQTTFESSVPRKNQVELVIPYAVSGYPDYDPYELINTQLGWGEVESATYDVRTCRLTLRLRHE